MPNIEYTSRLSINTTNKVYKTITRWHVW